LAVVSGCERFHIYIYGKEFTLYTDHKPLEVLYNPKHKPPPRIERWAPRIQPYKIKVIRMPGKTNPADVLLSLPLQGQPNREREITEENINYFASNSISKVMSQTDERRSGTTEVGKLSSW